ncbi:MAG: protein YgfX [Gammaproteobacteria bacterium]
MNKNYALSFEWSINASVIQRRLLLVTHSLAVTALLISAIVPVYKVLLVLSITFSGYVYWRAYGPGKGAVTVRYTDALGWELLVNRQYRPIRILKSTVLTPWVLVLHYRMDDKNRYWAIFNDALDKKSFCRLTAQLKIAGINA